MFFNKQLIIACICFLLWSCGGGSSSEPPTGNPNGGPDLVNPPTAAAALSAPGATRDFLTREDLESPTYPHTSPIHNGYFMPVGETDDALHRFSGTLSLDARRILGDFEDFRIDGDENFKNFPLVDLSFISHAGYLIPVNRDRQVSLTDESFWGIILDPGRVWSEPSDGGWSRASFPFTLISARRNQAQNGIASFIYNDSEISYVRIQVVQETTLWFQKDMYSQLSPTYNPREFAQADTLIASFQSELLSSVAIKDWAELNTIGNEQDRRRFNSNLPDNSISQTAVIKDEEVYLQGCFTRYGEYPYCRWMRNGAYSITKSIGAAFTLFRLAELHGPQVFDLFIEDYVSVSSNHDGWRGVTFGDVLNMAAGIGDEGGTAGSGDIFADENGPKMERWIAVDDEQGKLNISFSYGNYSWGPGEVFRYNSALYIVLAAALDNYYKSVEGENADIWQMVVEDVYNVIGVQHVPMIRTIEGDGSFGIAEMFHGLYPNIDDMAKLSQLIQNGGMHNGIQLLHQESLRQALFKTNVQGLRSWWEDNQYGQSRYVHGFWSSPFGDSAGCLKQIPYMSGYGGNIFAILDNDTSVFRFSDSESYSPANMIEVMNEERAICQ